MIGAFWWCLLKKKHWYVNVEHNHCNELYTINTFPQRVDKTENEISVISLNFDFLNNAEYHVDIKF